MTYRSACNGNDRLGVSCFCLSGASKDMTNLSNGICFTDDINVVFEALSEWCYLHKKDPNSLEGCRAASTLFDLFQDGYATKESLLNAMDRCEPAERAENVFRAVEGGCASPVRPRVLIGARTGRR